MRKFVVLAFCSMLLVTGLLVTGCGGGGGGGSTPEEVVRTFMEATKNQDVDALWSVLSKDDKKSLNKEELRNQAKSEPDAKFEYTVGKAKIKGDNATVEVKVKGTGMEDMSVPVKLTREDGDWKVRFQETAGEN